MADWRPYGYIGQPETCRWCGRTLRWVKSAFTPGNKGVPIPVKERPNMYSKPGDYGDGHFCGLRCGYQFGVRIANREIETGAE